MTHRKLIAGAAVLVAVGGGTSVALAAHNAAAPRHVIVKQKDGSKLKPNRFIQDELRFDKDVYTVRSGGTVTLESTQVREGPHSLSVLKSNDVPKTASQANNCAACNRLGAAHGIDPNSEGPPKFQFVENGVGQSTPPNLDRPGDSAISGPNKGDKVTLPVTAKPGTTLHFICLFHPWMQAEVKVVK